MKKEISYWRLAISVFVWVVALMSGALSLARELLGIYKPQAVDSGALFWTCARVSFILSAVFLIVKQQRELKELRTSSSAPHIKGEINITTAQFHHPSIPAGAVMVIVNGLLTNAYGAATALANFQLSILMNNETIRGRIPSDTGQDVVIPLSQDGKLTLPNRNYWPTKTLTPLVAGAAVDGWFWSVFSGVDREALYNNQATAVMTFKDVVTEQTHEITKVFTTVGLVADPSQLF